MQAQPHLERGPGLLAPQLGVLVREDLLCRPFGGEQRAPGRATQPGGVEVAGLRDQRRLDEGALVLAEPLRQPARGAGDDCGVLGGQHPGGECLLVTGR